MGEAPARRVFISYAESDEPLAEQLRAELATHGIEASTGVAAAAPGTSVSGTIGEALEQADGYLLLISGDWLRSRWALLELGGAVAQSTNHGKPLVPVVTERGVELPVVLRDRQYLDLTQTRSAGAAAAQIARAFERPAVPPPPAPTPAPASLDIVQQAGEVLHKERIAYSIDRQAAERRALAGFRIGVIALGLVAIVVGVTLSLDPGFLVAALIGAVLGAAAVTWGGRR